MNRRLNPRHLGNLPWVSFRNGIMCGCVFGAYYQMYTTHKRTHSVWRWPIQTLCVLLSKYATWTHSRDRLMETKLSSSHQHLRATSIGYHSRAFWSNSYRPLQTTSTAAPLVLEPAASNNHFKVYSTLFTNQRSWLDICSRFIFLDENLGAIRHLLGVGYLLPYFSGCVP